MLTAIDKEPCWHCDNWMYSLIFWNEEIGKYNKVNSLGIDRKSKKNAIKTLKELNGSTYYDNRHAPVLYTGAANYRPRPFFDLVDFLHRLEKDEPIEPEYEKQAIKDCKAVYKFSDFKKLNQNKLEKVNRYIDEHIA